jgi:4-hydroxybenzoate polyprenyltransferase
MALTQLLFYYCIVLPVFLSTGSIPVTDNLSIFLIVFSSLTIAAAGYIINDYFDVNMDLINKPEKIVIEKHIHRRSAIIWHWVLSGLGVLLGFWAGYRLGVFWLGPANMFCAILLWFYSTIFKKKLLSGNVIISLLTAWVVLVMGFVNLYLIMINNSSLQLSISDVSHISKFTFLYAGFAFLISLIREVIKDIEDIEGDRKYGGQTMPIVWGIHVSKVFSGTLLIILLGCITILEVYIIQFKWWYTLGYCIIFISLPLIRAVLLLLKARTAEEFCKLSNLIKYIMLTGILSMVFLVNY